MFLNLIHDQISSYSPMYTKLYLAAFSYAKVTNPRSLTLSVWFQPIISGLSSVTCDLALVTRLFPCTDHRPWTFPEIISWSLFLLVLYLYILVIYLFTNLIIHPFSIQVIESMTSGLQVSFIPQNHIPNNLKIFFLKNFHHLLSSDHLNIPFSSRSNSTKLSNEPITLLCVLIYA